jgi:hypothetical protein
VVHTRQFRLHAFVSPGKGGNLRFTFEHLKKQTAPAAADHPAAAPAAAPAPSAKPAPFTAFKLSDADVKRIADAVPAFKLSDADVKRIADAVPAFKLSDADVKRIADAIDEGMRSNLEAFGTDLLDKLYRAS